MIRDEIKMEIKTKLTKYVELRNDCILIRNRIENKQKDIAYLKTLAQSGTLPHNRDITQQTERAIKMIEGLTEYYLKTITKRESTEQDILEMLKSVDDDRGRKIIYLHYIEGIPFEKIPPRLDICDRTMWYKHKQAIEDMCTAEADRQVLASL